MSPSSSLKTQPIITTTPLEERWCQSVVKHIENQQDPDSLQATEWEHRLLRHAWKIVLNTRQRKYNAAVDERIWLSIAVLAESIDQVRIDLFPDPMLAPSDIPSWLAQQQ